MSSPSTARPEAKTLISAPVRRTPLDGWIMLAGIAIAVIAVITAAMVG